MSKILVTGATGHLGKAVVNELLGKVNAGELSVLVRDREKAAEFETRGIHVIKGDYLDFDSLVSSFQGVDKLYFVSSSDVANRLVQHQNVVKAAVEAGVKHLVYTSAQRKSEDGSSPVALVADAHVKTDNLIQQSGLTYTILKHGLYADVLTMFLGERVIETGTVFLPAGEGKSSYATRADLAATGAIVLTTPGHENKVYELGGPVACSFAEIAAMLSELSGKAIKYVSPSVAVYAEQLKSYGLPEQAIQAAASFCSAIAQGEFDFPSIQLERLLGRKPESVKEFLKSAYHL